MRLPDPFHAHGEHIAIELGAARALFTTRRGGASSGPYNSLNLGRFTDDDPEAVEANRQLVARLAGGQLAYGRQVHGSTVARVRTAPSESAQAKEADGQVTALNGVAPMVLTADCLPIAVAAPGAVAMIHAGWRGLADGVIAEGVRAIRAFSARGPLSAAIGPGAGPCCYEVGEDVHARFAAHGPDARNGQNLDLKAIARAQLARAEVAEIHDVGLCTMCSDPSLFYSHRRENGVTGRQAGVAWLS